MSRNPTRPDLRSGWVLPALPVLLSLALLEVSVRSSSPEGPAPAGREPSAREALVGRSDQGGAVGLRGSERAEVRLPTHEELKRVRWTPRPTVDYLDHLRRAIERETPLLAEEEALELANVDEESNRKILSALGRPPRNDEEVDWEATFNRFIAGEPRSLNPLFSSSRYDFWVEDLLYVGPIQFDWNLEAYGDRNVIESWDSSEDRLMDRIVLRPDLRWTDGQPVTAYDVEFTWKLLVDPRISVEARRTMVEDLLAVKAYDERTVVYLHKEALATNHLKLIWPILPKHAFEKALIEDPTLETCPLNREPITCGPYRLVHWRPGQEILMERREEWYRNAGGEEIRSKPFFRQVRFRILPQNATRLFAFLAGDTDDTQLDSAQWVNQSSDDRFRARGVKVRGDEWTYAFIGWNARSVPPNPFFGDRRVRWAMTFALDHEFLLGEVLHGIYRPGVSIFHPESWMAADGLEPVRHDMKRAEELLDEAGWKDSDGDGVRDKLVDGEKVAFRFTLHCPNAGSGPLVAKQLKEDLKMIGVECDVELIEWNAFQAALAERRVVAFPMSMGTGVDPDTARNLWGAKAIAEGRNHVGFANERVDELLEQGRREFDPAKRAAIYAEVDRIIYEEKPITVLLYVPTLWAFSKSLRGYRPSAKGFYGFSPGFFAVWKKK